MRNILVAGALILGSSAPALAQLPGSNVRPYTRPAFSPYLNLNRPGSSAAINYFGLVRPQLQFNSEIQQLQQATHDLAQRPPAVADSELPATGHATGFMTHQRFFLNGGRSAGGPR